MIPLLETDCISLEVQQQRAPVIQDMIHWECEALCLSNWDTKFILGEIVLLRNRSCKGSWLSDSLFCGWLGVLYVGRSQQFGVMQLSNISFVMLKQRLADLCTGQIQKHGSYARFTKLEFLRAASQESVFFKALQILQTSGGCLFGSHCLRKLSTEL